MYYVYVLKSLRFKDKIYIGYTSDLNKRLEEHMAGKNYTSKKILPVELVYRAMHLTQVTPRYSIAVYGRLSPNSDGI